MKISFSDISLNIEELPQNFMKNFVESWYYSELSESPQRIIPFDYKEIYFTLNVETMSQTEMLECLNFWSWMRDDTIVNQLIVMMCYYNDNDSSTFFDSIDWYRSSNFYRKLIKYFYTSKHLVMRCDTFFMFEKIIHCTKGPLLELYKNAVLDLLSDEEIIPVLKVASLMGYYTSIRDSLNYKLSGSVNFEFSDDMYMKLSTIFYHKFSLNPNEKESIGVAKFLRDIELEEVKECDKGKEKIFLFLFREKRRPINLRVFKEDEEEIKNILKSVKEFEYLLSVTNE